MGKDYKKIEVRKQQQLTKSETFDFCLSSIKHRFFRSLLTLAVVVLAVAFFMYLLTENVIIDSLKKGVEKEINIARKSAHQVNLMFNKPTLKEFTKLLANSADDSKKQETMAAVLGVEKDIITRMTQIASAEEVYLGFFYNIKIGQRHVLVGQNTEEDIFLYLNKDKNFLDFKKRLEPMGSIKFPGGYEKFTKFLNTFQTFQKQRNQYHAAWNKKINKLIDASDKLTDFEPLKNFLGNSDQKQRDAWRKLVASFGFKFSDTDFDKILVMMKNAVLKEQIVIRLNDPEMRKSWRAIYGKKRNKIGEKLEILDSAKVMKLLEKDFSKEELRRTAVQFRYDNKMRKLENSLDFGAPKEAGALFSGRNVYLLVLSFIVCMVGIANAMLMSITERFREIATLKCLGATDSFILIQIMIEAGLQGLAGGAIGVLIGLLLTIIKDVCLYDGTRLFTYFPISGVLIAITASLVAGVLLSVLASIYPSLKASRMAPMEAMRIE